jgi:D-alanyl-D-alanine carboxypeptidase
MVDLRTGRVLWQRGGRRALPVASLSKVMTALLVVERRAAGSRIRIPAAALRVRGSHAGLPAAGRRVAVEDLLRGLLLPSGNDAAVALAVGVAGSERAFVARMNRRARRWGMTCTRFVSVHGLGAGNRVCPRDLAHLARRATAAPRIARIVRRRTALARLGPGGAPVRLVSTNPLTAAGVPGVLGLKTGWAPYAGRCLITVVRRGGRRLAIVLLDAPDRVRSVRVLLAGLRGRTRR